MEETIKDIIDGVPDEPSDAENNEYIVLLLRCLTQKIQKGKITADEFKIVDSWLDFIRERFSELVKP